MFRQTFPVRGYGLAFEAPDLASGNLWAIALTALSIIAVFRFHAGMAKTFLGAAAAGALLWGIGWAG
jgi:chromate transporter